MTNFYDPGDSVKVAFTVLNNSGVATDPNTLRLRYRKADGTWVSKVYGTDVEVVKASTGNYYIIVYVPNAADSSGDWYYEGEALDGSSNPLTVSQGKFVVRRSSRLN
jgi:hypothetical protein